MTEYGIKADYKHDYSESSKYQPRHLATFAERGDANGVIGDQDPFWIVSGPSGDAATDGFVKIGIADGSGSWPDIGTAAYIKLENGKVTTNPGIVLNPTTEGAAPATKGSMMYDSGTDELKYWDGAWQVVSAGGLSSHVLDGAYHTATGLTVGWVISADSPTTFSWKAPTGGGTDDDAIHDNVANEITAITPKTTLGSTDEFVLEDGGASFVKKAVTFANIESSISLANLGTRTHASLSDAPADAHHVAFVLADFTTAFAAESLANLATRTHASLSDAPTDAHHNETHVLAVTGPHTGTLPWTDLDKTGSSLADLATRAHSNLSDAPTSAHHVRYADSEVRTVITAECAEEQIIDDAIDALILTHKNIATAHQDAPNLIAQHAADDDIHHTPYTDTMTEAVITAEIVDGQSIDLAIDNLISAHANDDDAHHALVTVTATPLTLSGQAITFHYDSHHFKLAADPPDLQMGTDNPNTDEVITWNGTDAVWSAPSLGSGTQWTIPVWATTGTLGDSMISQDSGGTYLTVSGDIVLLDTEIRRDDGTSCLALMGGNTEATGAQIIIGGKTYASPGDIVFQLRAGAAASEFRIWDYDGATGYTEIFVLTHLGALQFDGSLTVGSIAAGGSDYNKFLVSDGGLVKFRTGAEAYSDMDGYVTADFTTDFAAESLANLTTRTHGSLSDAPESAHHVRYADYEVESVITAELVGGQSIDNAIDFLINAHAVANRHIDHSTVSVTAGTGLSGGGTIAATRTINCDITQYTDALARTACISNVAYGVGWQAVTTIGASKGSLYNKLNAMDTLIAANTTVVEVEAVITAELVNGQSIDLAIDSLILTHKNISTAHHTKYTNSEAVAAVVAENPLALTNALNIGSIPGGVADYGKFLVSHNGLVKSRTESETRSDLDVYSEAETDSAIDTDISTHAALTNIHHPQSHTLSTHTDLTITGPYLEDLLMFGSANAAWVPVSYIGNANAGISLDQTVSRFVFNDAGTHTLLFWLNLPTVKGGLKLHVSGTRIGLEDADSNNKVSNRFVGGHTFNVRTQIDNNPDDLITANLHDDPFTAVDCSSYNIVVFEIQFVVSGVALINVSFIELRCYYAP